MTVEQSVAVMSASVDANELPVSGYTAGMSSGAHSVSISFSQAGTSVVGDKTFSVGVHANILVTPN